MGSCCLANPGKEVFLKIAADAVRDDNPQSDSNGVPYAQKVMIQCDMSLGLYGKSSELQLTQNLQEIIPKNSP